MNTATSLASGALGALLVALTFLLKHESQIKGLLNLLPTIASDAAKAKAAVDSGTVVQAVTHVRTEVVGDIEAVVRRVLREQAAATAPAPTAPTQPAA